MVDHVTTGPHELVQTLFERESRFVFASLVRLLRDFDLAEEALQEAFATAIERWPTEGTPADPRSWLVSTGRFKAIDLLRRRGRFEERRGEVSKRHEAIAEANRTKAETPIEDDRLRLIFACCHPAIAIEVQVPLTLREVCGLSTEQIASAFLTSTTTMAQRLVRGKNKIRSANIPIEIPSADEFAERLHGVLSVVYLVFNEGYSASSGEQVTCVQFSSEAIRLGRLLLELCPEPEVMGLLGLMLLQESRRHARTKAGEIVLLEDQDRTLWDQAMIAEGAELIQRALASNQVGEYTLQGAIAFEHARADHPEATRWAQIVALYDALLVLSPNPVIALNRAVAIAMRDGPLVGVALIDEIFAQGELSNFHLAHAARAELLRRHGDLPAAKLGFEKALSLATQAPEQRFLRQRIAECS